MNKIHLKAKHRRTECRLWDEKEEKRKTKTEERKKQANLISAGITEADYTENAKTAEEITGDEKEERKKKQKKERNKQTSFLPGSRKRITLRMQNCRGKYRWITVMVNAWNDMTLVLCAIRIDLNSGMQSCWNIQTISIKILAWSIYIYFWVPFVFFLLYFQWSCLSFLL